MYIAPVNWLFTAIIMRISKKHPGTRQQDGVKPDIKVLSPGENNLPAHRKFLCKCNSRNRCAALGQPLYDFFSSLLSVHAPIRPFNSGRRVLFLQLFDRATNCPYALLSSNGCRFFREMSKMGAECVSAPLEIKSTPRSVSLAIFSLVTLPDTSISALPSM